MTERATALLRRIAVGSAACVAFCVASPAEAADPDPWISRDKAFHFDASAGVAAASYAVSAAWLVDARWKALAIGGAVAIGVGAGKELVDASGLFGGDPSWRDFAWDGIGAVAGLALAWGADLLLGGVSSQRPALAPASAAGPVVTAAAGPLGATWGVRF